MSPIAAGLLFDAVVLICVTALALAGKMQVSTAQTIISMVLAARFSSAVRGALVPGITGSGTGGGGADNSGGFPRTPSSPNLPPPTERRAQTALVRILHASGVAVLLCIIPIGLATLVRRHIHSGT